MRKVSVRLSQSITLALFGLMLGGCTNSCSTIQPAPAPIPPDQVVEGGAQVRVTPSGMQTISNAALAIIQQQLANGVCVPPPAEQSALGYTTHVCESNDCYGGAQGCDINVNVKGLNLTTNGGNIVVADITMDISSNSIPVYADGWAGTLGCDGSDPLTLSMPDTHIVANIALDIDPTTGELGLHLDSFDQLVFNPSIGGCGALGSILDFVSGIVSGLFSSDGIFGTTLTNLLAPLIDGFLQNMLPKPLGVEGVVDLGAYLSSISAGVDAKLEVKGVPGGYAETPNNGLSIGLITGFNADSDPSTRDPLGTNPPTGLSSEPSACVPQWGPPNLGAAPWNLPLVPGRNTYSLLPADTFMGNPDPAADLAIGVSRTTLDLAGHHIVSSGAMCLGVGSSFLPQLNLGTIGVLVRSLSELGTGKDPVLLVLRPTEPINFSIGTGTMTDPYITAHIVNLDVDMYAFIYERYVRAFTMTVNVDLGVNLTFMYDAAGNPTIQPMLVGLDENSIQVTFSNTDFIRETPAQLEAVFPTLLNVVLPLLSGGLPAFPVPSFNGFTLGNLQLTKVSTSQDDFLAIFASLIQSPSPKPVRIEPVQTSARIVGVKTPTADEILAGKLPQVEVAVDGDVEWQWRLDGGMWHVFQSSPDAILTDKAFALQGHHTIDVRSRTPGVYESLDTNGVSLPVLIDSVAPHILTDGVTTDDSDLIVPVYEAVSDIRDVQFAFGSLAQDIPNTGWTYGEADGGHIKLGAAQTLAGESGQLKVYLKDEAGNTAVSTIDVGQVVAFHGQTKPSQGCGCHVGDGTPHDHGGPAAAILGVLFAFAAGLAGRGRKALRVVAKAGKYLPFVALALIAGLAPGCNCGGNPLGKVECSTDMDCAAFCPAGKVGVCGMDGKCTCFDDIPIGQIGLYSHVAATSSGIAYVSAYNTTHGDLMVAAVGNTGRIPVDAYDFVDGVPSGPVVFPNSMVRHGIRAPGDDVGLYTSIAVLSDDTPVVSYYDKTNQALRFAAQYGGQWTSYAIDKGVVSSDDTQPSKDVGKYTSITVDSQGIIGIAYLAIVNEGGGVSHSEVRYAQSKAPMPMSNTDWNLWIVDSAPVGPPPANGAPVDEPPVLGLFITSARKSDGSAVIAYYDRPNGALKVAQFNAANNDFDQPIEVDGDLANGNDVGWYPSVVVTPDDVVHLTYIDAEHDNLLYTNLQDNTPEIVDDGYRIEGNNAENIPDPVFDFVGDNAQLIGTSGFLAVVYQDATTEELMMAVRQPDGSWMKTAIAGFEQPYAGSYGFWASAVLSGPDIVMSSYVINQQQFDSWVEVFREKSGLIQ